jgi:hypothetical protein
MVDLLAFAIFVTSLFGNSVVWRGHEYRLQWDGRMISDGERLP